MIIRIQTLTRAAVACCLFSTALLHGAIITTTEDGYVREGSANTVMDSGISENLMVRSDNGGNNDQVRKAYLKFDLTGLNADTTAGATFTATVSHRANNQNGDRDFYFYGLDSGFTPTGSELGTNWTEETLTWNNAPANDTVTNIDQGFDATASLIYTASGQFNTPVGKVYTVNIPTLGDYVQADNSVTLMISWEDGVEYGFGSKENTTVAYRPTLEFAVIPEPSSLALMLVAGLCTLALRKKRN